MPRMPFLAILLSLLVVAPLADAAWRSNGQQEPDTSHDIQDGWMFTEPDATANPANAFVYFNGFVSQEPELLGYQAISLNLAAAGTALASENVLPMAILGVWKDCNGDGYVGAADAGLLQAYPATLLPAGSPCAVGSGPFTHNDGLTVTELLPIYWHNDTSEPQYAMNYWGPAQRPIPGFFDNGARVWADLGQPDDPNLGICRSSPQPQGTFGSTGGMLAYADCFDGYVLTHDVNTATEGAGLSSLSFGDVQDGDQQHSGSVANQRTRSACVAFEFMMGAPCDCVLAPWVCEQTSSQLRGRTRPDSELSSPCFTCEGAHVQTVDSLLGKDNPIRNPRVVNPESPYAYWYAPHGQSLPMSPAFDRGSVFPDARHLTFYAFVSPTAASRYGLVLPPAGAASYGAESCAKGLGGFDCAQGDWWRDANGNEITAVVPDGPNYFPSWIGESRV